MSQSGNRDNVLMKFTYPDGRPPSYYYTDGLPGAAKLYKVLTVIGCILSTPVILLCCLPNLKSIKKVSTSYFFFLK